MRDKPVWHVFKFIPDAKIWACLGEDPKHIQICRWNELPHWLFCLYCKLLAFSPHLLASTYSANKVFVLLLLVEIQLGEWVLPCHPHCWFSNQHSSFSFKTAGFCPYGRSYEVLLGRVHIVPEGGFDQHFFSLLSSPCLAYINLGNVTRVRSVYFPYNILPFCSWFFLKMLMYKLLFLHGGDNVFFLFC